MPWINWLVDAGLLSPLVAWVVWSIVHYQPDDADWIAGESDEEEMIF